MVSWSILQLEMTKSLCDMKHNSAFHLQQATPKPTALEAQQLLTKFGSGSFITVAHTGNERICALS